MLFRGFVFEARRGRVHPNFWYPQGERRTKNPGQKLYVRKIKNSTSGDLSPEEPEPEPERKYAKPRGFFLSATAEKNQNGKFQTLATRDTLHGSRSNLAQSDRAADMYVSTPGRAG